MVTSYFGLMFIIILIHCFYVVNRLEDKLGIIVGFYYHCPFDD